MDLDPSMMLAFLIPSRDAWTDWRQEMSSSKHKIIQILDTAPSLHRSMSISEEGTEDMVVLEEDE